MTTLTPELIYMLKVNAGIALFYAFYKLFCCRDTFFQWRRIALLSFLALSFLYPLMDIQTWVKEQPVIHELADYYALMMWTDAGTAAATVPASAATPAPTLIDLLGFVYWGGIVLLSARFIIQLLSIFRLVSRSRSTRIDQISIRSLPEPANPFSFWQWIFIYLPGLKENERREILMHEQTHVRQWHSIDVILSETVNIICWMNPFAWLLKAEIRLNLEYLADHKVMEAGTDRKEYQYHLLGLANQNRQTGLYNNFNLSHLKNRIRMMNKQRTCTTGRIKYALFAPLTAALLLVSNIETVARTAERLISPVEETGHGIALPTGEMTAEGIVTYHVTVVNSEGKPQPNLVIQTKLGDLQTFTTDADGKATIELDMANLRSAYLMISVPNSKADRTKGFTLEPKQTERTIVFDTMKDVDAYARAGKKVTVKLCVRNTASQPVAGAVLVSSDSKQKVTSDNSGNAEMKVGIKEKIAISKAGFQDQTYHAASANPIKDMTQPMNISLLKTGEKPVFQVVENMPEFPGGMTGCLDFISKNVRFPEKAKQEGIGGKVIVQFIVEADGTLSNPVVVRSIEPTLDEEAIRLIKTMPAWKPGTQRGQAVRCKYTLPVDFKLP